MTAGEIAQALGGRRCGRGWMARCPAHQDRSPSLSIAERNGKLLFFCHAGCAWKNVAAALRARGLWPDRPAPDLTAEEWRELAKARRRDERDARPARYWAIAAEALIGELLERLEPWDVERANLTGLLRTVRGPALLQEFRNWRQDWPALTRALIKAGERLIEARERQAIAVLLGREGA